MVALCPVSKFDNRSTSLSKRALISSPVDLSSNIDKRLTSLLVSVDRLFGYFHKPVMNPLHPQRHNHAAEFPFETLEDFSLFPQNHTSEPVRYVSYNEC